MERIQQNAPTPAQTLAPAPAPALEADAVGMDNSMATALLAQALPTSAGASADYTVQEGDTLWDIAGQRLGDPARWSEIADENALEDPSLIGVGQRLRISGSAGAPDPVAPAGGGGSRQEQVQPVGPTGPQQKDGQGPADPTTGPTAPTTKPSLNGAKSGLKSAWASAPAGSYSATKAGAHQTAEALRAAVERGEISQAEAQGQLAALGRMWTAADRAQKAIAAFNAGSSEEAMAAAHEAAELTRALVEQGHISAEEAAPVIGAMGGFYTKAKARQQVGAPSGGGAGQGGGSTPTGGNRSGMAGSMSTPLLDQNTAGGSYPGGYCAIAALRMVLRREGLKDPGADAIALTHVPGYGQPYAPGQGSSGAILAQRAQQLGLKGASFTTTDNMDNITASIEAGRPVMVGGIGAFDGKFESAHQSARYGSFSAGEHQRRRYDGSGHWVLAVGVRKDGSGRVTDVIVNDPDTGGRMTMSRADFEEFVGHNGDMWTIRYQEGPKSKQEAAERASGKPGGKPGGGPAQGGTGKDPVQEKDPARSPDLSPQGRATLDAARQGLSGAWSQASGGGFAGAREGAHAAAERVREAIKSGQLSASAGQSTIDQAGRLYNAARLAEQAQRDMAEGRFNEAMVSAHEAAELARSLSASGLLKPEEISSLVSSMGSIYTKSKQSAPKQPANDASLGVTDRIQSGRLEGLDRNMAEIYNTKGKYLQAKAAELGIDVSTAAAVLQVESGGEAFSAPGKPIIRFENHIFYDEWGKRAPSTFDRHFTFNSGTPWTGHRFRPDSRSGWQGFHGDQEAENRVLKFASGLNEAGAYNSISMGLAQIMGFNHKMIGYDSAKEMYEDFSKGERQQLDGLFKFIQANPAALAALKRKDYATFAYYYNGSGQAETYGELIREAVGSYRNVTRGKTYR